MDGGATVYVKEGNDLYCVKVKHTGCSAKEWIRNANFSQDPIEMLQSYLSYHIGNRGDFGNHLMATSFSHVSKIENIWDNSLSIEKNIELFENGHSFLYTDSISQDYNKAYDDFVYLIDKDYGNYIEVKELY